MNLYFMVESNLNKKKLLEDKKTQLLLERERTIAYYDNGLKCINDEIAVIDRQNNALALAIDENLSEKLDFDLDKKIKK